MENIKHLKESVNEYASKYTKKQILTMIFAFLGIIILMTSMILYFTRTKYSVLYANLDLQSMNSITKSLDEKKIVYKIEGNDKILVPEKERNKIMINLAGEELPNARFSYSDLMKMNSMFLSDEEKSNARKYALSNEIASVIESIPEVKKAYVNLSIPKNSEFILNENKDVAKASVMLTLNDSKPLSPETVNGIVSIVANSVEGLKKENVTVHGPSGKVLNKLNDEDGTFDARDNFEITEKVKKEIENSLYNFLVPMFGYDNFSVMASVKLNFDDEKTKSTVFSSPIDGETSGIARSEQQSNEEVKNNSTAEGTPGVTANDNEEGGTTNYVTVDERGGSNYKRQESIVNYELNEIVKNVTKAKGTIDSVTVSVILNKDSLEGNELTKEKKESIQNLITTATGLDTKAVEVFAENFNKPSMEETENVGKIPLWQWIAIGIVALIPIILIGVLLFKKKKEDKKQEEKRKELERAKLKEEEEEIQDLGIDMKEDLKKKSIEELIDSNPEVVTRLIKTWIDEE